MNQWNIGLASWVIQDGNYPDFHRGEVIEFPVEFTLINGIVLSEKTEKSAYLLGDGRHQVVGEIIYLSGDKKFWILDFGIYAFGSGKAIAEAELNIGTTVRADIYLRVDEASYFSYVNKLPNIPPLIYRWKVEHIMLDTTPWIASNKFSSKNFVRDVSKVSYQKIEQTNAWSDGPSAEYDLGCTLLDEKPKWTLQQIK